MNIILGSASEGRQYVLKSMGLPFETMPADIDERVITAKTPQQLVVAIAKAKADALVGRVPKDSLLITGDFVIDFKGEIHGKPQTPGEARQFLEAYSDNTVAGVSAVVVTHVASGKQLAGVDTAFVMFDAIPDQVIATLLGEERTYRYAGAFSIIDPVVKPYIKKIEGDETTIIGLPAPLTKKFLVKYGYQL